MLNYPTLRILKSDFRPMLSTHKKRPSVCLNPQGLYSQICLFYKLVTEGSRTKIQFSYVLSIQHSFCTIQIHVQIAVITTIIIHHLLPSGLVVQSIEQKKMDQIRRSWVRFPPRSKTVFFASCGSLFPYQG